jgi:hypothetical protein
MDAIFKGIQKMNDSDNKQLMVILFKYNRALQDKIATHRTAHLPSAGAYVPYDHLEEEGSGPRRCLLRRDGPGLEVM